MSDQNLIDTMKAQNDFCSVCLRTKTEVKLDQISTKMYQMFFVGLVQCVESEKTSKSMCVWCRRRVVNALKLVETAQRTNRILVNIMRTDKSDYQSFKQIFWDQIQTNRRMYGLTPKTSQVISCNVLSDTLIGLPMKLEREDSIASEEGNICFDSVINENRLYQPQCTEETPDLTSRASQDVSCNLLPDTRIDLLVKQEQDINERDLNPKGSFALESHNFLASRPGSHVDDKLTLQSNVTEKTPCLNELEREDSIASEEGNICFDSVINENRLYQPQCTEETPDLTSRASQDVSCNLLPDTRIDLLVKQEQDINERDLNPKGSFALESHNSLASRPGSHIDDKLTLQSNVTAKTPCLNEGRRWNNIRTYSVTKKKTKEIELKKTMNTEVLKLKPIDTDENQNSAPKEVNEEVSRNGLQNGRDHVKVEDSDINSQMTYSSADASKHIHVLHLTEAQRLQELEERRRDSNYYNSIYKCEPCILGFCFPATYNTHVERHSKRYGSYKCSVCSVYFKHRRSYQIHCKGHYERYACAVCGRNFLSKQGALNHYVLQHTNERFKCEHCTSKFGTSSSMKMHMRMVHDTNRPLFPCPHSSRVLSTKSSYKIHTAQHDFCKKSDKSYSHCCDVCSRTFLSEYRLHRHRETHSNKKTFPCQNCNKSFKSWMSLYEHRGRKHSVVCFECDYCLKTFGFKEDLRKHITWTHLGHGFKCQFCSKMLRFRFLLEQHIKQEHNTVCEVCNEEFSNNDVLNIHRRMHSTVSPAQSTPQVTSIALDSRDTCN